MTNDMQRIQVICQTSLRLGPVWEFFASRILFQGLVIERSGTSIAEQRKVKARARKQHTPKRTRNPNQPRGEGAATQNQDTPKNRGTPNSKSTNRCGPYIYVYTYIDIHTYLHTHICVCLYIIYIYTYICIYQFWALLYPQKLHRHLTPPSPSMDRGQPGSRPSHCAHTSLGVADGENLS